MLGRALALVHVGRTPTRAALTAELGVTRATAGSVAAWLQELRLIRVHTRPAASAGALGRPSHRLVIDPDGPVALAAQVHADGFDVALIGLGAQVAPGGHASVTMRGDPGQVLRAVAEAGAKLLRSSGRTCVGAGLAVPSAIAEPEGTALNPLHVDWPAGTPVRDTFTEQVRRAGITGPGGLPSACMVANDISAAALAEYRHGAGSGAENLLVVATGRRGVGGALVLDGKLYAGSRNLAMQVGHITVNPGGPICVCGSRGCLDVETDPLSLLAAVGREPRADMPVLQQAIALLTKEYAADPAVRTAAGRLIDRLGLGLAGLINVLNPDRVLLGGLHRYLLNVDARRLRSVVSDRSLWGRLAGIPILSCALDDNSLIGAAELAWQPVLDDPLAALNPVPR